ncbi:hypothetical protein DFH29DRAFT_928228 [Suillus ampliporus]|nr:hypothetical protein DFH29DRAFT_928228 [Suillus ampliporus]
MPSNAGRKFIDLIRQSTAKWANWDPPIPVQVGAYGRLNTETGELDIEGNIYDPEFQVMLDVVDGRLKLADYPAQIGAVEEDFIVCTMGVRQNDLRLDGEINIAGLSQASIKGEWQFQRGRRGALLIMHHPRQEYVPRGRVLETLYKVPELKDMHIVVSTFKCPAFTMYLSDKSGEKISLALTPSENPNEPQQWWSDTNASMLRKGQHKDYMFTPLYGLKRKLPLIRRLMRDSPIPDPEGDDFWVDVHVPWDPLDEDGDEDSSYEGEEEDGWVEAPERVEGNHSESDSS